MPQAYAAVGSINEDMQLSVDSEDHPLGGDLRHLEVKTEDMLIEDSQVPVPYVRAE